MRCTTCHYSLTGLAEHRCPECGSAFDPDDPSTFDSSTMRPGTRLAIRIAIMVIVLLALVTGIVAIYVYWAFSSGLRNYRP